MQCPGETMFVEFTERRLDDASRTAMEAHVDECEACRMTLAQLAGGSMRLPRAAGARAAGAAASAELPRSGDILDGKYRIGAILGRGGMGIVFAAEHLVLRSQVAIKFLLPAGLASSGRERFLREARAAARLKSVHVARVLDVTVSDAGLDYVVMEYLEGRTVADELRARGQLPVAEAVGLVLQAIEAVAEAHAQGIVHRDLKPGNLFLVTGHAGAPRLKVLDFGLAKALPEGDVSDLALTSSRTVLGSPLYMPPEQAADARRVDHRADIWALGVVLYELVVGHAPFGGRTLVEVVTNIVSGPPPAAMSSVRRECPTELDRVVRRCLERDRERRWSTVAELAAALAPFTVERAPVARSRRRVLASGGVVVAAAAASIAALVWWRPGGEVSARPATPTAIAAPMPPPAAAPALPTTAAAPLVERPSLGAPPIVDATPPAQSTQPSPSKRRARKAAPRSDRPSEPAATVTPSPPPSEGAGPGDPLAERQ